MPRRSWMAVIAVAALLGPAAAHAGEQPITNRVNLQLQIIGIETEGCTVEIRPGHSECRFPAVVRKVAMNTGGTARLDPIAIDATTSHADRDCAFAITIKEPGRPPRTYRRGLVLKSTPEGQPAVVQSFPCVLTAPSLAAKDEPGSKTRR